MTKERDPVSIEDTLMEVLGQLKMKDAAKLLGCSASYLQATTDPDKREQLSVCHLEQLDLAHHAKFGRGFPLYEALGRRLATARAERFADAAEIGRCGARLARENGEAVQALVEASLVSGDRKLVLEALRQVEDVHQESTSTIAALRAVAARLAGEAPDTS